MEPEFLVIKIKTLDIASKLRKDQLSNIELTKGIVKVTEIRKRRFNSNIVPFTFLLAKLALRSKKIT
jgi:hypothetical protein